jgi:hypothetical protein
MSEELATARRLRRGAADAEDALVRLGRIADPSLWQGPAAGAFAAVVAARTRQLRALLEDVHAAAAALEAAGPGR